MFVEIEISKNWNLRLPSLGSKMSDMWREVSLRSKDLCPIRLPQESLTMDENGVVVYETSGIYINSNIIYTPEN